MRAAPTPPSCSRPLKGPNRATHRRQRPQQPRRPPPIRTTRIILCRRRGITRTSGWFPIRGPVTAQSQTKLGLTSRAGRSGELASRFSFRELDPSAKCCVSSGSMSLGTASHSTAHRSPAPPDCPGIAWPLDDHRNNRYLLAGHGSAAQGCRSEDRCREDWAAKIGA